jgi:calcineurin-like phosphoesterase family protein
MRNAWLISDTHFDHANILTFRGGDGELIRGDRFASVEQMNQEMYDHWAETVAPGDIVYHLGDVMMGEKESTVETIRKLPGRKRLIVGNHDDIPFLVGTGIFQKVQMWRMFPELGVLLSHVPIHRESKLRLLNRKGKYPEDAVELYNIHGHIHQWDPPEGRYFNVCVEKTDYRPINLEELTNRLTG